MVDLPKDPIRIYVLVRGDITIPTGKFGVQIGHAVLGTYLDAAGRVLAAHYDPYYTYAQEYAQDPVHAKILLRVPTEKFLHEYAEKCTTLAPSPLMLVPHHLVTDLAKTVFREPTVTCLGIGPLPKSEAFTRLGLDLFDPY